MNMLFFDEDEFASQTRDILNRSLSSNQIHLYSVDQNTKTVKFDILPLDEDDNIPGKDFNREEAIEMARVFGENKLAYNFSGVIPKYDVRLLQVRENEETNTFIEKSDSKNNDPLKSEPERSIIITLLVLAGLGVIGFVVMLLSRSQNQFPQGFPQFPGMMGGGGFGQGPMSPGAPMGPMSPHLGGMQPGMQPGMHPLSPTNSFGAQSAMATPQGAMGGVAMGGGSGWSTLRNTVGAASAFGTAGKLYGVGAGQPGMDTVNPSFMQQNAMKGGTFSPRFYMGGMQPNG